jgi:hypothetical protein
MRLANRVRGGEAVAETGGEIRVECGDRLARKAALALADRKLGHWASLCWTPKD